MNESRGQLLPGSRGPDSGQQADGRMEGEQSRMASPISEAATGDVAGTHDRQASVLLSVSTGDVRILTALIDRTASGRRIIDDLRRALPEFAVPYRELERRIVEAIWVKSSESLTFEEASIRVFGTPDYARRIRYWRNKWGLP
jgi:hypothetical protein